MTILDRLVWQSAASSVLSWKKSIWNAHDALKKGDVTWDEVPFHIRKELLARGFSRAVFSRP